MSNDTNDSNNELPVFPAQAPDSMSDPATMIELITSVLDQLADVIDVSADAVDGPTPCKTYSVGQLQRHALAWLQFFAAALTDPDRVVERLDTETWALGSGDNAAELVRTSRDQIVAAIEGGVADQLVVMSQARMAGGAVVAMALGEYIVHGWDLAVSTSRDWKVSDDAAIQAHQFLLTTVAPEYRGEDSGFFGDEVEVPSDAAPLDKLLGFAGRDPGWRP